MNHTKSLIFTLFVICITGLCYAQNIDGVFKSVGFRDYCYDNNIKTARLYKVGNEISDPVINLRSTDALVLTFDDLASDTRRFYYTVSHCDADWKEDNLLQSEYMTGFPETQITTFNYSVNTRVSYANFSLRIPNNDVQFKLSGNYLLKVYDATTREIVLQKGFSIVEPLARISANMRNSASTNQNCTQQIEFKVSHPSLKVNDAFMDLKVRIEQNSERIPGVAHPMPAFTQPGATDYTRPDRNMFKGNNEFRAFDIRNLSFNGVGVQRMTRDAGVYKILLNEDKIKTRYVANKDNNGKYVIGADLASDPAVEADYADVFFTLVANVPFVDGRVFIVGEFTDWNIDNWYEMTYNPVLSQYEANIQLKQGYYNYRYVVLNNDGTVNWDEIDGCFAETENDYTIYIYYKTYSDRFDRLVGFERINSRTVYK